MSTNDQYHSQYADAIVQTVRHPVLVLDGELRVESANARFYETFHTSEERTVGRLLYELANGEWNIPQLRALLEDILPRQGACDACEVVHDFAGLGRRILLLNSRRIDHPRRILLAIDDMTQWHEAERRTAQLRALAIQLTRVEQRERRYLAGILHDHLQQQLVAAKMHAGIVEQDLADGSQRQLLLQVLRLLDESIATTRSLSVELSAPVLYERGLAAGLEWLAGQMQRQYGLAVHIVTDPRADPSDPDLCELLFYATRELLLNVVKHAERIARGCR